jgi:hypothetical protein
VKWLVKPGELVLLRGLSLQVLFVAHLHLRLIFGLPSRCPLLGNDIVSMFELVLSVLYLDLCTIVVGHILEAALLLDGQNSFCQFK